MEDAALQAKSLWDKFLTVTMEMRKFMEKDDVDMFLSLLEQRLRLQKLIEALPRNEYHFTPEGKEVLAKIAPLNGEIQRRVQRWLNEKKRGQSMARAYDSLGYSTTGGQFNRTF